MPRVDEQIPRDVRALHRKVLELIKAVNAQRVVAVRVHTQSMNVNGVYVPIPSTHGRVEETGDGTIIVLEP